MTETAAAMIPEGDTDEIGHMMMAVEDTPQAGAGGGAISLARDHPAGTVLAAERPLATTADPDPLAATTGMIEASPARAWGLWTGSGWAAGSWATRLNRRIPFPGGTSRALPRIRWRQAAGQRGHGLQWRLWVRQLPMAVAPALAAGALRAAMASPWRLPPLPLLLLLLLLPSPAPGLLGEIHSGVRGGTRLLGWAA